MRPSRLTGQRALQEQVLALRQQVHDVDYEVRQLRAESAHARRALAAAPATETPAAAAAPATWVPPGHYYSPLVDTAELAQDAARVFDRNAPLPGIRLREQEQLNFLDVVARHFPSLPFQEQAQPGHRYRYQNPAYSYGDGIVLGALLLEVRPQRVIEFGSGWSSCAALDVADVMGDHAPQFTFVDPYPGLLRELLLAGDEERVRIVPSRAQDVDLTLTGELAAGDILFIDSTHVSKAGSDVNFHLFTLLPSLPSGVYIHFHDVFFPFEYPEKWFFEENRSWNELYLLRAFLQHNEEYDIVFFNDHVRRIAPERFLSAAPPIAKNAGGALWLRKR